MLLLDLIWYAAEVLMVQKRMRARLIPMVWLTVVFAGTPAFSGVIFDALSDPAAPSGTGIAYPISIDGAPVWDSFTPQVSETLTSLSMVLYGVPVGNSSDTLQVGLFQDNHTTPGTLITNIVSVTADHLSGVPVSDDPDDSGYRAYNLPLAVNPSVQAGTRYWIGMLDDSTGAWAWTFLTSYSVGASGEYFANVSGVSPDGGGPYEMTLTGTPVNVTPEPASICLLGLSAVVGLVFRFGFGKRKCCT